MKVSITGQDKIISSFNKSGQLLSSLANDALETSAKLVKQRARRTAGSPPIVNTGELARGIDYQMRGSKAVRVGADARYSPFVEYGRGAGRMPPVAPIERWARTKIGKSGLGFAIARKIGRKGTKAQPFFYPAVQESLREIQSIFETMLARFAKAL